MPTPFEPALDADLPAATAEQWRSLVDKVLKGGDFERRLVARTADGIRIEPLHPARRSAAPVVGRLAGHAWRVAQRVDHPDCSLASPQALADLDGGADALTLVFAGSRSARGFGLTSDTVDDLDRSLAGVMLDLITVRVDPEPSGRRNAAAIAALVRRRGLDPASLSIDFGLDPLGTLLDVGAIGAPWVETGRKLADTVSALKADGFAGPFVTCDLRLIHEAGGSEAQELAYAMAAGVAYLRALEANGIALPAATAALSWTIAVDADQVLGIAKLRALRKLWARVEQASGLQPHPIRMHAETAWRMQTRRDPWVNLLRATLATFVAGIGGADTVTVLPHTATLGLPDAFARRVARNTQIVLLEEAGLARVTDPAAGSGAFEAVTDDLASTAWRLFQEIEAEGGIVASLTSGKFQSRITAQRTSRLASIATRKIALTGTSEFPNLSEVSPAVLDVAVGARRGASKQAADTASASFGEIFAALQAGTAPPAAPQTAGPALIAEALPSHRLAEPFERLRDASDAALHRTGQRPRLFLASLGALAEHAARTTWVSNVLAAGGIEAVSGSSQGFTASADVGRAFASSGTAVACICGSDDTYAELADATAHVLRAAGAKHIILAGKPGALEAPLRAAGVDGFLAAGQDALAALTALQAECCVNG